MNRARTQVVLRLSLALLAGGSASGAMAAEEKPLWEAGMGVATVSFPAYRGSDQSQAFVLPTPYFVYRGEFLKADKDGVRAELLDADRVKVTLSGALSPPAYSRDIRVREGMPDLRANFEVGPQLNLTLWQSDNQRQELKLLVPLRAAFTLERSPKSIGWVFHPKLNVDFGGIPGLTGWNAGMQLGPLFGDRKQHQYFYGVDAASATANRPAYQATGGFAGTQYILGVSKRYDKTWVGAFLRYDSLRGASFADSPLVRTRNYVAGGIAISWILGESAERVRVND